MLPFILLGARQDLTTTLATEKNAYCIYVDDFKECRKLATTLSTDLITYKPINLTNDKIVVATVPTSGSDEIVMFVQKNIITPTQLKILLGDTFRPIYVNGNQVSVTVDPKDELTFIPMSLTYTGGPISYKPTAGTQPLSHEDIQKIHIKIDLKAAMDYMIYDTYDCSLPSNFNVASGGSLTYSLKSNSLDITRMVIKGDNVEWGSTTIKPGDSQLHLQEKTIISHVGSKPTTPIKVGGGCYFDETFDGAKTDVFTEITSDSYVLNTASIGYLKVTSGSAVEYKAHCVYDDSVSEVKDGCTHSGFSSMVHQKVSGSAIDAKNIVSFNGKVTVPKAKLAVLACVLMTNDATEILIKCNTGTLPDTTIDVRKGIWRLSVDASTALALSDVELAFTTEINPNMITDGFKLTGKGIAITSDTITSTPVDLSKITISGITDATVPITPYVQGEAKVLVQDGSIVINGVTLTVPQNSNIGLVTVPGQNMILSQKGATNKMKVKVESTGKVAFDSSWNSVSEPIVIITGATTVSTDFVGIPPWLVSSSVASLGAIEQAGPLQEKPEEKGLESWAIAVIVIACVIVVAVIAVVVLNMTGVIHLCGKKKVEV